MSVQADRSPEKDLSDAEERGSGEHRLPCCCCDCDPLTHGHERIYSSCPDITCSLAWGLMRNAIRVVVRDRRSRVRKNIKKYVIVTCQEGTRELRNYQLSDVAHASATVLGRPQAYSIVSLSPLTCSATCTSSETAYLGGVMPMSHRYSIPTCRRQ